VLSGRGLCDELITLPEKSYRLWCVVVCDLVTSRIRRPWPALGRSVTKKKLPDILLIEQLSLSLGFAGGYPDWLDMLYRIKKCVVLVVRASRQLPKPKQKLSLGDFSCGMKKAARPMPVRV
jgi:hypothetical protein